MPAGRPTVMTPEVLGKLFAAFALDARVEAACAYANISKASYYDYIKKQPEFSDEVEALRQQPYLKAVQTVVSKLDDADFALKYLERKAKKEFAVRQEHTGPEGEPIETKDQPGSELVKKLVASLEEATKAKEEEK